MNDLEDLFEAPKSEIIRDRSSQEKCDFLEITASCTYAGFLSGVITGSAFAESLLVYGKILKDDNYVNNIYDGMVGFTMFTACVCTLYGLFMSAGVIYNIKQMEKDKQ